MAEKLIELLDQEEFYVEELLKVEYAAVWKKPRKERCLPLALTAPQTTKGKWIVRQGLPEIEKEVKKYGE